MIKKIQLLSVSMTVLCLFSVIPMTALAVDTPSISYCTHVQNVGWQDYVRMGEMSGTEGKGLRLEGIRINLDNAGYDLGIEYQTHIQNIGWETDTDKGWSTSNVFSGTEGLGYRLEAIQIQLTGDDADQFDIYYRVHAQNIGWMGWAKNGESAGTAGYGYRLEGIEIQIVPLESAAPGSRENAFRDIKDQDYKSIYKNILKNAKDGSVMQYYSIFDMDNNGIPELLLCTGNSSIDIMAYVFTCENETYKTLGVFHVGHTVFYGENSSTEGQLIGSWFHQGNHRAFNINLLNGNLIETTISSGFTETNYKTDNPIPQSNIDDISLLNSFSY